MQGLTIAKGFELAKTEIELDGQRTEIPDAQHFKPDYPGVCSIIFVLKKKNEVVGEVKADNLTIKPIPFSDPTIEEAPVIAGYFSWYNNLTLKTKEFIYNHLLTSYICMDRFQLDDMEYIIM